MPTGWTKETALIELSTLAEETRSLTEKRRFSEEHVRWVARSSAFLEEVFGQESRYYQTLVSLSWQQSGSFVMGGPGDREASWNPAAAIEKRHQKAYQEQLESARGLLLAAADHLARTDLGSVHQGTVNIPSMKVTREGVFFAGQYFDALQRIREILTQAQKSITIIDGYVNEDVLNLLTEKKPGVEVNILTKTVSPALKTAAIAFNRQYGNLSIRTSQTFHDRFVIADDLDFYHFGASIKDLGHRGFMFSLIEEPEVINLLREKLAQEWASGMAVV